MRKLAVACLLIGYVLLACQTISFANNADDLGRHLRDGELILAGKSSAIFHLNYYSYTHPDAPFLNHHWLTSVIFYLISKAMGLAGLNVVYVALGAIAFLLYFRIAEREAGLASATALAALLLPLMAVRSGIRPEVFSMLLLGVFFTILWGVYRGDIRQSWLWALPVIELVWVNLHPGFALGPVLIGIFWIADLVSRRFTATPSPWNLRVLASVLALSVLAALANPNGIRGVLFPAQVASNYAMPVRENLSVFSLQDEWLSVMIELGVAVLLLGSVIAYRRGAKMEWPLLLFSGVMGVMSLVFFRIYVFLGFFVLVATCVNLRAIRALKRKPQPASNLVPLCAIGAACLNILLMVAPRWGTVGLGLDPHDADLAQFVTQNHIHGKVFNGYASGGYLIYYFPDQPVYIDSRPEAYPGDFIRDQYLLPLADENAWNGVLRTYDFDFILFARLNQDEGQFLVRRLRDPEWVLVYSGYQSLMVRRKPEFQDVISRYAK